MRKLLQVLTLSLIFFSCNPSDKKAQKMDADQSNSQQESNESDYEEFMERLRAEEPYIGFFAAEEKYISTITPKYFEARKVCFQGINRSKEEPFDFVDPFIELCKEEGLIKLNEEEAWENMLTTLSYEMYPNMPIFNFLTEQVIEHRNLTYAEYPNKKLDLDLFLPKRPIKKPMPVVVCIHGGGFVVNKRIWFEPFAKYLATNGMAAVTIDYRKLTAVELKDIVGDTKAAIRWVRANAEKYNLDPDKIGAIGASAGAYLVALLGTTGEVPELEGTGGNPNFSSTIQAVFGIATPALGPSTSPERMARFGFTKEEFNLLSPYQNIDQSSAPLFLLHGTEDEIVPPESAQELHDKYKELGLHVQLEWVPDEGHGFYEGKDFAIFRATEFFISRLAE
tara:strand:+ start:1293 stop:2474 length:1182 start_codon:yes stop_codon:yes gene_type:complete